jgi:hypothetical protein
MQPLDKDLRNKLDKTVKEARQVAEAAAAAALEQFGVAEANPYAHLSDAERDLRRRLRVHGRQLGDSRDGQTQYQECGRLIEEIAYEHWHRMLFARFLAENDLLMYDGVAVTLEECEELALDQGLANGWVLAARLSSKMLPQIFRTESPVFDLSFALNYQLPLERLVADLPSAVFTASDSLGWVYQFWQAKKKDEVNAAEVKIGARELPAVTQLFTEPYMVSFLLDNALGAWWAARRLSADDLKNADSEEELRQKAAIPGVPLEYLRFVRVPSPQAEEGQGEIWTPAAGTFDGWPEHLADLKTLDPCCGSGHFLVAAFLMLVPMRMELEGMSAREAVDAVLRDNLHGLELDQRCVELAAFALALTAWKYPSAGGYRVLPELNLACSGLSISAKKEEWLALAGDNTNLRIALGEIHNQFKDAPVLGSLINPEASLGTGTLFELKLHEVGLLLNKALTDEKNDERTEIGVVAQGVTKSAELLSKNYHCVATNPPYLGEKKQSATLRKYSQDNYHNGKADLSTAFVMRGEQFCPGATQCLVLPQNWLYQRSYQGFRKTLLDNNRIRHITQLGANAFASPVGADVLLLVVSEGGDSFTCQELTQHNNATEKALLINKLPIKILYSSNLLSHDDARITLAHRNINIPTLEAYSTCCAGILNGDTPRFIGLFWEVSFNHYPSWSFLQRTTDSTKHYSGMSNIILWEGGTGQLRQLAIELKERLHDADRRGNQAWGKQGIAISQMGKLPASFYLGNLYDQSVAMIIPKSEEHQSAIMACCESEYFSDEVRKIDKNLKVTVSTLLKVPFELDYWTQVAAERYPNGLPKPYTDDPTQWIFHGHPCGSVIWDEEQKWTAHGPLRTDDTVLQVAVARLLGYRWPAEQDTSMELADEQREWVRRCEALASYADEDGIVCIPPVRGEAAASDRLLNLLAAAYGDAWSNDTLAALLTSADHAGKTLETWLREKFFTQHCKLFQHRPFIWHIWDGLRDGFAALVNYHKLDYKTLEALIYTYLGDWISRQKQDIVNGVDGAQERLAAAEALKKKLELILEGEAPYDIFVRWKPLERQPIGWNPDLNDGVRLNIRPFMSVLDVGKKGAGVLRDKPNIKWDKDRGKDVESAPWYHKFNGDRINDHHLSLEEKRIAKAAAQ